MILNDISKPFHQYHQTDQEIVRCNVKFSLFFRIHPQIARISGLPFFLGVAIYCYEVGNTTEHHGYRDIASMRQTVALASVIFPGKVRFFLEGERKTPAANKFTNSN